MCSLRLGTCQPESEVHVTGFQCVFREHGRRTSANNATYVQRQNVVSALSSSGKEDFSKHPYSARSASVGFIEAARLAGKKLASNDAAAKMRPTPTNVVPSHAFTPKRSLCMSDAAVI